MRERAWPNLWSTAAAQLRLRLSGAVPPLARLPVLGRVIRRVGNQLVPRGATVWRKIRNGEARGCWILLDARSEADLESGGREPAVQEALRRHLDRGMIFYDIGANVGFFCLLAARLVGPEGRIFGFEPEPDAALRLRSVVGRNELGNVMVVEKAVWSNSGEVSFDRGLGSPDRFVGHVAEGPGAGCCSVPAVTLDDFARSAAPPDVIKCDAEGAEVQVFRGAGSVLTTTRPVVICEVHSAEILSELELLFRNANYELSPLSSEQIFPSHILAVPNP
jgi:FkbM family methyltransferase